MMSRRRSLRLCATGALLGLAARAMAATPDFAIVSPQEGATLKGPVLLRMSVSNARLGSPRDGLYHLHFSVDGGEEVALYELKDVLLRLAPGRHVIAVELAGPNHRALGVPRKVAFTVSE